MSIKEVQLCPSETGVAANSNLSQESGSFRAPGSLIWICFSKSNTELSLVFDQMWLFILTVSRRSGALWNHPGSVTLEQPQQLLKVRVEKSGSSSRRTWKRAASVLKCSCAARWIVFGLCLAGRGSWLGCCQGLSFKGWGVGRGWEGTGFLCGWRTSEVLVYMRSSRRASNVGMMSEFPWNGNAYCWNYPGMRSFLAIK